MGMPTNAKELFDDQVPKAIAKNSAGSYCNSST